MADDCSFDILLDGVKIRVCSGHGSTGLLALLNQRRQVDHLTATELQLSLHQPRAGITIVVNGEVEFGLGGTKKSSLAFL